MKSICIKTVVIIALLTAYIKADAQRFNGTYKPEFKHTVDKAATNECNSCFITINGNYIETGFDLSLRPLNEDGSAGDLLSNYTGAGSAELMGESFSIRGKVKYNIFDEGNPAERLDYWFQMDGTLSETDYLSTITGNVRIVASEADLDKYNNSGKWTFSFTATNSEKRAEDEDIITGAFGSISGQVEVQLPGETEWRDAIESIPLKPGTIIRTAEESSCVLSFHDMSTFALKANSSVEIVHMAEDNSKVKLVLGKLWTNVKKMARDGKMEVSTTQAVAGIKGTTFIVGYENGISSLEVIEGVVAYKSLFSGEEIDIKAGESITADSSGLGGKRSIDIKEVKAEWAAITDKTNTEGSFLSNKMLIYILAAAVLLLISATVILIYFTRKKRQKVRKTIISPPAPPIIQVNTQPPSQPFTSAPPYIQSAKFCPFCGNKLKPEAKFCGSCGKSLK